MRKRNNSIRRYFSFCKETNKSVCLCPDEEHSRVCACNLTGTKSSNLKSHVRRLHPTVYAEYLKNSDSDGSHKLTQHVIAPTSDQLKVKKFARTRGRKKRSFIRQYFLFCPETNRSKCLCQEEDDPSICGVLLRGNKASNLKVHVRKRHPQLYEHYLKLETLHVGRAVVNGTATRYDTPASSEKSTIRDYFEYCPETDKSECLCLNVNESSRCAYQLTGSKTSNLKTHVRKRHPEIYAEYLKTADAEGSQLNPQVHINDTHTATVNHQIISVLINKEDVLNGIVESVAVNGRPLSWFLDSGFQRAFGASLNAANIVVNARTVVDLIKDRSQKIRDKLRSTASRKLVCVKVDCVTISDRLFIGIHVQFILNGEIVVFTLNTLESQVLHIEEILKYIVVAELEKFGIDCKNIYTVTIDDGINAFKMLLSTDEDENVDEYASDFVDASELVECLQSYDWQENNITNIRCAAHTLQLCVGDALRDDRNSPVRNYIDAIKSARVYVEVIENHEDVVAVIDSCGLEKPSLDVSFRWNSTYAMLKRLLLVRSHCDALTTEGTHTVLPEECWDTIFEIVQCLLPFEKAASRLQNENLTITDAYKIFNICQMETAEIGSPFSQELLYSMNRRRPEIFEHDVFLAAMFLDPRFNFELDELQRERATKHLLFLCEKLEGWQKNDISATVSANIVLPDCDIDDPAELRYEKFLSQKHKSKLQASATAPEFEIVCKTFNPPRLKTHENVLQFWELNKNVYPELYPLAIIIFAVPSTQVSTSRTLSQLKFNSNHLKRSWMTDIADDILLLNGNFRLYPVL